MPNVMTITQTDLFKELEKKQREMGIGPLISCDNIETICGEASDRMKQMPAIHPQFTLHEETHLLRVTQLMALVLGPSLAELNALEIALLILAAHLHDQGMVPEEADRVTIEKSEGFRIHRELWLVEHPNFGELLTQLSSVGLDENHRKGIALKVAELEYAMWGEHIRRTHGERSAEFIRKQYREDNRLKIGGVSVADVLATLCLSHVQDPHELAKLLRDKLIGNNPVNLQYLAVVLRLADVLDFDRERTPDALYRTIHFSSEVSISEWEKHRSVHGWKIEASLEAAIIRFEMEFDHPIYERSARQFLDQIDRELAAARELVSGFPGTFTRYKLLLPLHVDRTRVGPKDGAYVYYDLEFSLSRDEIVKLLMTHNLYGAPSLCVRELLQNSMDALHYRSALFKCRDADWTQGEIKFEHGIDENNQEFLRCTDNGVGMDEDVIKEFLTKVGRSFYRSPWFERERLRFREKGVDFDPCSQFGIGFMSCFMLGDRIRIETMRDNGPGRLYGVPWVVEINGLSSILILRHGSESQEPGTTVEITIRGKTERPVWEEDQVRLVPTLKKYARAVDYPISAHCSVPEFADSVRIESGFRFPLTFLERVGVKQEHILRIDEKVSESDQTGSLIGVVSESFLADESGMIAVANKGAAWELYDTNAPDATQSVQSAAINFTGEIQLRISAGKTHSVTRSHSIEDVVCADGIEVSSGSPDHGMNVYPAVLIDTRGKMKPRLTPARQAITSGEQWSQISQVRRRARGMIWAQLARSIPETLTIENFWKLAKIYGAPLRDMPSGMTWDHVVLPVGAPDQAKYMRLSDTHIMSFEELKPGSPSAGYRLVNDLGYAIGVEYQSLVLGFTELRRETDNSVRLYVINPAYPSDCPLSPRVLSPMDGSRQLTSIKTCNLMFGGDLKPALCAYCGPTVKNHAHPLVEACEKYKYGNRYTFMINQFLSALGEGNPCNPTPDIAPQQSKSRRSAGISYKTIRWEKLGAELRPPYRMFSPLHGWSQVTDADLRGWAQMPVSEDG